MPESRLSNPPIEGSETVSVNLKMLVPPQQEIRVQLPFLETFKLAYMQYISFLILSYFVVYKGILGFAYERKVMGTQIVSEIRSQNVSGLATKVK